MMDLYTQIGLDSSHSIPAVCPVLPGLHKTATAGYYFVIMNIRLLKKKPLSAIIFLKKRSSQHGSKETYVAVKMFGI